MYLEYQGLGSTVDILLILLEKGQMTRREFMAVTSYDSAMKILRRLQTVGLTDAEEVGDRRDTIIWRLTPKGEKAAKMLKEVEDFIKEE